MKHRYLITLCLFWHAAGISQNPLPCAADFLNRKALQDPGLFQQHRAWEQQALEFFRHKKTHLPTSESQGLKTVPVVVHIIHDNGPENISDALVQQGIARLNQALANEGYFNQGSGASTGIQLCLAQRTPEGLPTNGITRDQSPLTELELETEDLLMKNLNRWKPKDYVNIWVLRSICSSAQGCGVGGYAYYPTSHGFNWDGIVVEAPLLGSEEAKVSGLAHEVGHYFGLYHTFEGSCTNNDCLSDGDRICDTPPDQSTAYVPCDQAVNTCSTDALSGPFTSDQADMIGNFMDYSHFTCLQDFTPDQATRMNFALDGIRKSLLLSKGCLPPCPAPTLAAFTPSATTVAAGQTVTFANNSQNAQSFTWSLNGSVFGSQPDASYTFGQVGTFTVNLLAQPLNSALCELDAAQAVIQVVCPVTASFTASDLSPDAGETITLTNTSQGATQYEWFVNGASQGAVLDSLAFGGSGVFEITLEAGNGFCTVSATELIAVRDSCENFNFMLRFDSLTFDTSNYTIATQSGIAAMQLADGNFLFLGKSQYDYFYFLAKTKPDGSWIWAKRHTGGEPKDICAAGDGGFLLLDYTFVSTDGSEAAIYRFDADGEVVWSKKYQVVTSNYALTRIKPDPQGGYIVCGGISPGSSYQGAFYLKLKENGDEEWSRIYRSFQEVASDILPLPGGGYLAVGHSFTDTIFGYYYRGFVHRLDASGNLLWNKGYGAAYNHRGFTHIVPGLDGNYLIAGTYNIQFPTSSFLLKIDISGHLLWSKDYRRTMSPGTHSILFQGIAQSPLGGYLVCGYDKVSNPPQGFLARLDESGHVLEATDLGAMRLADMQPIASGGYVLAGENMPNQSALLIKSDETGNTGACTHPSMTIEEDPEFIYTGTKNLQSFAGPAAVPSFGTSEDITLFSTQVCAAQCGEECLNKTFEYGIIWEADPFFYSGNSAVTVLGDGSLLVAGDGYVSDTDQSPVFIKMKPDGTKIWTKTVGLDSTGTDPVATVVKATPGGGFVAYVYENPWNPPADDGYHYLAKFSADGVLIWAKKMPGGFPQFEEFDILVNTDGSIIVNRPFLSKFDSNGDLLWAKTYSGGQKLALCPDGGFCGFDPSPGSVNGILLTRYYPDGNVQWRRNFDNFSLTPRDLMVMPDGSIFIAGLKRASIPLDHGFLLKLSSEGQVIWAKEYRQQQIPASTYEFWAMTHSPAGNIVLAGFASAYNPVTSLESYNLLLETDPDGNILWSRHRPGGNIGVRDMASLPGGGYCVVGSSRILRTNDLGQTEGCPEVPHTMSAEDFALTGSLSAIIIGDTSLLPESVTFPVPELLLKLDTVCAPACLYRPEICYNNLDDDHDGLFDCLDPECACEEDPCQPQHANIWYFGDHSGLDFNTEPPTVLTGGQTLNLNSSATMSDGEGNLLFYSDGKNVYNRFHQPMPNGILINGFPNFGAESLIVPYPGDNKRYYLFTVGPFVNQGLHYTLIDMSLDDGRGDVMDGQKFVELPAIGEVGPGLTAVKSCSFNGYWVLTHSIAGNSYKAIKVTENGLFPSSSLGEFPVTVGGQVKISPNGKHVALATQDNFIEILDFDADGSGNVSNPRILESSASTLGVEFSPNSRFLYVSEIEMNGQGSVLQFDLEAGDETAIQHSMVILASKADSGVGYLQLAPNGKILMRGKKLPAMDYSPLLDIIHHPNAPGTACLFQENALDLSPGAGAAGGLCNFVTSYFSETRIAFPFDAPDTICDLNTPILYHITNVSCGADSLSWTLEGIPGTLDANGDTVQVTFSTPGTGRLIVTTHSLCGIASDTLQIVVPEPFDKTLDLGPDRLVCDNGVFTFHAGSGFARYRWNTGSADSSITTLLPGPYWVDVWNDCGEKQSDTVTVSIAPSTVLDLGPDVLNQCSDFVASFSRPSAFAAWQWSPSDFLSCADCPTVTVSPAQSNTWIVTAQTAEGCLSLDTLHIQVRDTLLFSLDTSICQGMTVTIFGQQLPADTSAQFFSPAPGPGCDTLLTVNVLGIEPPLLTVNATICPATFFNFRGALLPADTTAIFRLPTATGCDTLATVKTESLPPLTLLLPMDTSILIGASVLLESDVNGTSVLEFAWSPADWLSCSDCPDPLASPLDTIAYSLVVTDANGCTARESVVIRVGEECDVHIPNAFTPNGDGANDRFYPITDPCVKTLRLWRVLNRWGDTVFEQTNFAPNDPASGWDGTWKGHPFPSDVLVWVAELEYYDGRVEARSGELTLLR